MTRSRFGTKKVYVVKQKAPPPSAVRAPSGYKCLEASASPYAVHTFHLHFKDYFDSKRAPIAVTRDPRRPPATLHNVLFRSLTEEKYDFILVKVDAKDTKKVLSRGVSLDGKTYLLDVMSGSLFKADPHGRRTLIGIPQEAGEFFQKFFGFEESVYYASRALFPHVIAGVQGPLRGRACPLSEESPPLFTLTHKTTGETLQLPVHDGWGYVRGSVAAKMEQTLGKTKRQRTGRSNPNYQMFQWLETEQEEVLEELAKYAEKYVQPKGSGEKVYSTKQIYSAVTTGRPALQLGVAMPAPGDKVVFPATAKRFQKVGEGGVILSRAPADKPNLYPVEREGLECTGTLSSFLDTLECIQYTWTGREDGHLTFFKGMAGVIPEDWWPPEWQQLDVITCAKDRKLDERWRVEQDRERAHAEERDFILQGSLVAVDWFAAGEAVGVPYAIQSWLGGDYDGDEVQVLFESRNPSLFQQVKKEFKLEAVNPKLKKVFTPSASISRRDRLLAMASKNTERWSVIAAKVNALSHEGRARLIQELARPLIVKDEPSLFKEIGTGIKVGTDSYKTSERVADWEKLAGTYERALSKQFGGGPLPYNKSLIDLLKSGCKPDLALREWRDPYFQCFNTCPLPAIKGTMALQGVSARVMGRILHRRLPLEQKTPEKLEAFFTQWLTDKSIASTRVEEIVASEPAQKMLKELHVRVD